MPTLKIFHRWTGAVLFEAECGSLKLAVEAAVLAKISLIGANLSGANLEGANLDRANLDGLWARAPRLPRFWLRFGPEKWTGLCMRASALAWSARSQTPAASRIGRSNTTARVIAFRPRGAAVTPHG